MDASDFEADVWLQKNSADLLADLCQSLPKLLRKPTKVSGTSKLRFRVRMREVSRLDSLVLDRFLELPQLLDPHLQELVPPLASAYLEYLQTRGLQPSLRTKSHLIEPLSQAAARLLYSFCKIRGEKVIVRFLNVEPKYLELLLSAIETDYALGQSPSADLKDRWTWQERYIILLWLSQLLLAPFDLSTISSVDLEDLTIPDIPRFVWPKNLPGITARLIPLAMTYLEAAGKERDGAKALLVRMSMRRDMQQMGVLSALVDWALQCLEETEDGSVQSAYYYNGRLAFLAGVLRASMDTSDMNQYLQRIFRAVFALTMGESAVAHSVMESSVARKMIIKVMRSVTALILRREDQDDDAMELVETCITFFMERLGDNDTPVRLAASKALSIITLRLPPDMAEQVVKAVLDALNQKVIWISNPKNPDAPNTRDISAVDPLEWHGLTLTLAHLLYRRSPPTAQLSDIIHALLLGLSFEQRGPAGASIGTNVRDAACFGIWAISRRYTTAELLAVPIHSVLAATVHTSAPSILLVLATDLVVTASRDPSGNIRRGASAALQELIGRHPDIVVQGIFVVQTVDYNAVALRSRAIHEVSLNATKLHRQYGEALQMALLTWRGVGDADAAARRVTGTSFGTLTMELARMETDTAVGQFQRAVRLVVADVEGLQARQAEERHGLVLCLAALLDQVPALTSLVKEQGADAQIAELSAFVRGLFDTVTMLLKEMHSGTFRREELLAEAASRLSVALLPVIQSTLFADTFRDLELLPGHEILRPGHSDRVRAYVSALDGSTGAEASGSTRDTIGHVAQVLGSVLQGWLDYDDQDTVDAVSGAGLVYLILRKREQRAAVVQTWADVIRTRQTNRSAHGYGYFYAIAMSFPVTQTVLETSGRRNSEVISNALLGRWRADRDIETRVAILKSLTQNETLRQTPEVFLEMVGEGLNDYTTNARGDVGSLVRVAALKAAQCLWKGIETLAETEHGWLLESMRQLFPAVLRLAAEKLDRVRAEAYQTLALAINKQYFKEFSSLTFSSQQYFYMLLTLLTSPQRLQPLIAPTATADPHLWMTSLFAGFVTSAETGNEVLVINSRAALLYFCRQSSPGCTIALTSVAIALFANIKTYQGVDRVLVSSLEVTAFLMHAHLLQKCPEVDAKALCLQAQKAAYKTGNMRKIEACVKIYGGLARCDSGSVMGRSEEGKALARKRLGALWFHPWPKVRSLVVDEVWAVAGESEDGGTEELEKVLMGVNWGVAKKEEIQVAVGKLGFE